VVVVDVIKVVVLAALVDPVSLSSDTQIILQLL
jgi:hypothetical protein